MLSHKRTSIELFVVASVVLAACVPTITTPRVIALTQALPGASQPVVASAMPASVQATLAAAFKSKDPTTLTYLEVNSDPDTLDPALSYGAGHLIILNTYDTLILHNQGNPNSFVPQLATDVPSLTNGGISADGKDYTFKIRTGVKFHNGDPLTPGDVAFTFQRGLLQGGLGSPQWLLFQPILGLAASPSGNNDITDLIDPSGKLGDDRAGLLKADPAKLAAACQTVVAAVVADASANTVTFHLAQPWGPFLATLANHWGSITDKSWIGANGGWDGDCKTWQNFYSPAVKDSNKLKIGSGENGTGPYMLDHWKPTQEVVLKAFDGYWRTAPAWADGPTGAPKLKTIVLKTVVQDATRLAALQAGDADFIDPSDMIQMDALVGETCDAKGACQAASNPTQPLRVFTGLQSPFRGDVFFNFKINGTGGNNFTGSGTLDGNGIPPDFFNDIHVRKAFNYCFDWDALIKDNLQGEGQQAYDVMLPGEIGYSDQDPHYSYDPARCKSEFLASALKSAGGQSLWDTGFRFTIAYPSGNTFDQTVWQILSRNLSAVNPKFTVEVTAVPASTWQAARRDHKLPLLVLFWEEDIHDPHDWVAPYVTGIRRGDQLLPADLVKRLGELINQGVAETDPDRRAAVYKQFNQAFYDAAPDILLVSWDNREYEQRWVQGDYSSPVYPTYYYYALSKR